MRNLKKVLALVLAMAMSLSLAVTAGAAFTDQDAVNYDVAVDTMVELGVINGYTDGSFKPANAVTRAEAAKMIAFTVAGADEDTINYYAGATKFEDVTGSYAWASAAVNYCAGQDIIAGRSETVFDPGATVTGAELAKMILVALGYEPETANKAETLVGPNWQTNAISMALKLGLFEGLNNDFVATQAANREETAQIIFNALGANVKEVAFAIDGYYVYKDVMVDQEPVDLLAYAFDATATPVAGDFGRPATEYDFADPDIDTIVIPEYADFTFTGEVAAKDVFKTIGAEGVKADDHKYIIMEDIYVDGYAYEDENMQVSNTDSENVPGFGWGTTVEVYETSDKNEYTMVVINEYIGQVSGIVKADEDAGIERAVVVEDMTFETEDFAKKDFVLFTADYNVETSEYEIASMKAAPSIEGEVTKITNNETYTIDGVNYKLSAVNDLDKTPELKDSGSWYVDSMGNLIKEKALDDAEVFYGYLLDYDFAYGDEGGLLGNNTANGGEKVKFVDETGKVVVLDCAYETDDNGDIESFVAGWAKGASDILFSYELNSEGEISAVYEGLANGVGEDLTITKGNAKIGTFGKYGNDKTLYFYIDNTVDEEEYAVYTGYTAAPDKAGELAGWFVDGTTVEAIALIVEDGVGGQSDDDYVFFASNENEVVKEGDDVITTFTDVYVNGEKSSVKFDVDASEWDLAGEDGQLYIFTTSTKTGCVDTLSDPLLQPAAEIDEIASTYFMVGEDFYYVDSETVYYEIDEDGAMVKVDALEELSDDDVWTVNLRYFDGDMNNSEEPVDMVVFEVVD